MHKWAIYAKHSIINPHPYSHNQHASWISTHVTTGVQFSYLWFEQEQIKEQPWERSTFWSFSGYLVITKSWDSINKMNNKRFPNPNLTSGTSNATQPVSRFNPEALGSHPCAKRLILPKNCLRAAALLGHAAARPSNRGALIPAAPRAAAQPSHAAAWALSQPKIPVFLPLQFPFEPALKPKLNTTQTSLKHPFKHPNNTHIYPSS